MCVFFFFCYLLVAVSFITCWNVIWFNCQQDKDSFLISILDVWLNDFIRCDLRMIHCMLNSFLCRFMIHWTDQERRKTCYKFQPFDEVVKSFDCCHRTWSKIIIFQYFLYLHTESNLNYFSLCDKSWNNKTGMKGKRIEIIKLKRKDVLHFPDPFMLLNFLSYHK